MGTFLPFNPQKKKKIMEFCECWQGAKCHFQRDISSLSSRNPDPSRDVLGQEKPSRREKYSPGEATKCSRWEKRRHPERRDWAFPQGLEQVDSGEISQNFHIILISQGKGCGSWDAAASGVQHPRKYLE